jgi:nicotinamidase-related amidase
MAFTGMDVIIDKPGKGSFYATDLELILHSRGIRNLIISGIVRHCAEYTALHMNHAERRLMMLQLRRRAAVAQHQTDSATLLAALNSPAAARVS